MNRFILPLITIFISLTILRGQWEVLNKGLPGGLVSIDFVNENSGWLAGNVAGLLKTNDGGITWQQIPSKNSFELNQIDFVSETVGWAVAWVPDPGKSILLKTMDGGYSWSIKHETIEHTIHSLFAVDEDTVYALKYPAGILKTSDGGENWSDIAPYKENVSYQSLWFFDGQTGIVCGCYTKDNEYGSLVLYTSGGGTKWTEQWDSDIQSMNNLQFTQNSIGYFTAQYTSGQVLFCQTSDTCKTWDIISKRNNFIFSYWACSVDTIFAITSDTISIIGMNQIVERSTDSGHNWEKVRSLSNWVYSKIFFIKNTGYILGLIGGLMIGELNSGGVLFRSNDKGEQWELSILSYPFSEVCFIDKDKGFVAGGANEIHFMAGDVFETNDGGENLNLNFSTGGLISVCLFINDDLGYLLSRQGFAGSSIYKTEDGANHWTTVYKDNFDSTGISFYGNDMYFINANSGWAVGNYWDSANYYGVIFATNDGGVSWNIQWKIPYSESQNYNVNSIYFVNEGSGWAVGESGLIVKYTNQDQWQVKPIVTDLPLFDVFFCDEEHGWIAGGYYDDDNVYLKLFKTNNGGDSWQEIPDFDYQINDIYFADNLHGWVVGNDTSRSGIILTTMDGGDNWTVQVEGLSAPLNAIDFKDGYLWAVGGYGLILKSDITTDIWIDEKNNKIYPTRYTVHQNYPNPFNPITIISWHVGTTCMSPVHVEISIYNLLGQKIETILDKFMPAGYHEVEFDGQNLSSGVYLYRIQAGEWQDVRKMVYLK